MLSKESEEIQRFWTTAAENFLAHIARFILKWLRLTFRTSQQTRVCAAFLVDTPQKRQHLSLALPRPRNSSRRISVRLSSKLEINEVRIYTLIFFKGDLAHKGACRISLSLPNHIFDKRCQRNVSSDKKRGDRAVFAAMTVNSTNGLLWGVTPTVWSCSSVLDPGLKDKIWIASWLRCTCSIVDKD